MAHENSSSGPRRQVALLLGLAGAVLLAVAGLAADDRPKEMPYQTAGEIPGLDPSYRMTSHKVVLITDQALNPRLVKLDEGQLVAWISYSATESVVVFEREVARDMVCHSLVNFSLQEDELRSAPIRAGEFASFCQLKPGRYKYMITRDQVVGHEDTRRRLRGEIIVGDAQTK